MTINQAIKEDIQKIVEIDREAFGPGGISEDTIKSQSEVFPEGALVAQKSGKVIGVVCCERHKRQKFPSYNHDVGGSYDKNGNLLYLSVITVAEEFRNKGVGSLLLKKAAKLGQKLGVTKIYCPVNKKHPYLKKGVLHF